MPVIELVTSIHGGIAGKLSNTLVLTRYITRLLKKRNQVIKEVAEEDGIFGV